MNDRAFRLAFLLVVAAGSLGAETIHVRVLDGRNGRTIPKEKVQVWINDSKGALNLALGTDGIAELDAPAGSSIRIASNLYVDCRPFEKAAARPTYSVDEIKKSGLATQNTCGKVKVGASRGELIFFVRPLHWWEAMRR
jgi:hypothetical protein